jgi:hypothetical protein
VKGFGERLVLECQFFGISWLEVDLLGIIGPHRLRPRDKSIQEREASGNTLVLDVFAERLEPKHPNELELPLLFCSGRRKVPELVASTNAARERLDEFSRGLLGKMGGVEGVFLAGGSVASLSMKPDDYDDYPHKGLCHPNKALGGRMVILECKFISSMELTMGNFTILMRQYYHSSEPLDDHPGGTWEGSRL